MTDSEIVLSDAVALYLKNYPGKNDTEFNDDYGGHAASARAAVQQILDETLRFRPDWSQIVSSGRKVSR